MLTPLSGYPEYTHKARKAAGGINRTNDLDGTDGTHPHSEPEGRDTKRGSPSWLMPSAAGGKIKVSSTFSKVVGRQPPRRVALASAKPHHKAQESPLRRV